MPHSMRIVVLLPDPLGPRNAKTSPRSTWNEIWLTATWSPKHLRQVVHLNGGRQHRVRHPSLFWKRTALSANTARLKMASGSISGHSRSNPIPLSTTPRRISRK